MTGIRRFIVLTAVLVLGGCSAYHPLYGTSVNGESVAAALSSVAVVEQRTRAGQLVRNEILSSSNSESDSKFELRLLPKETTAAVSDLAGTNTKRKRYNLSVAFELLDMKSGSIVNTGASFSNVSYDTVQEPVADLQAANSAQSRAAQEVGQDVRQRIAAFLSSRKG